MHTICYYIIMFVKRKTLAYVYMILIPILLTRLMKVKFNSCTRNSQKDVLTCIVVPTLYPTSGVFRSLTKVTTYEKKLLLFKSEVASLFKEVFFLAQIINKRSYFFALSIFGSAYHLKTAITMHIFQNRIC